MRYALFLLTVFSLPASAGEVVTFCVELYGGTGECPGLDEPDACDLATDVWQEFTDLAVTLDGNYTNQSVDSSDFVEPSDETHPTGVDNADIAFFVGRGDISSNFCASSAHARYQVGDDGGTCTLEVEDLRLGGSGGADAAYISVWASHSNEECVVNANVYDSIDDGQDEFRMIAGWHGITFIDHFDWNEAGIWPYPVIPSLMKQYIAQSETNGVGEQWLDFSFDDRCSTVTVWGPNATSRDLLHEAGGWYDWKTDTTSNNHSFYFVDGCDAAGADPL